MAATKKAKSTAKKTSTATKKTELKKEHHILAALSYVGILFVLPMLMHPKNEYIQFHVKQGMVIFGLELLALALLFTVIFAALTPVLMIIAIAFSGYGFVSAYYGKKAKIPGAEWLIEYFNI